MIRHRNQQQRIAMRFDKSFQVSVYSDVFGEMVAIARNISEGGMGLEMHEPLPLRSVVTIRFRWPGQNEGVSVRAEVKHHYCFNYNVGDQAASTRGIGLRFLEFLEDFWEDDFLEDNEELHRDTFTRSRPIH